MNTFKSNLLESLIEALQASSLTVAAWEGGSAANGTTDQYSDIDLTIAGVDSIESIFEIVEATLEKVSTITHRHVEPKQFWPGYFQRIYFLENSPKHFFVDVGVFLKDSPGVLGEFLQTERHGSPVVHFDKIGIVKPTSIDASLFLEKQKVRLREMEALFPVHRTEVLKELDRGNNIDAFAFYFGGMVRPLVELMGMLHRPFRFDFGLRYLHRQFPEADQKRIEDFVYVGSADDLRESALTIDGLFQETAQKVRQKLYGRHE